MNTFYYITPDMSVGICLVDWSSYEDGLLTIYPYEHPCMNNLSLEKGFNISSKEDINKAIEMNYFCRGINQRDRFGKLLFLENYPLRVPNNDIMYNYSVLVLEIASRKEAKERYKKTQEDMSDSEYSEKELRKVLRLHSKEFEKLVLHYIYSKHLTNYGVVLLNGVICAENWDINYVPSNYEKNYKSGRLMEIGGYIYEENKEYIVSIEDGGKYYMTYQKWKLTKDKKEKENIFKQLNVILQKYKNE